MEIKPNLVGVLEQFLFSHSVGNVILPIDFHIFHGGRSTTNQTWNGFTVSHHDLLMLDGPATPRHDSKKQSCLDSSVGGIG